MNNAAYDISHLLELDAAMPALAEFRSGRPATIETQPSVGGAAQDRLGLELLQMEGQHEEMIRQYMSLKSDSELAADW